jgi:transposase
MFGASLKRVRFLGRSPCPESLNCYTHLAPKTVLNFIPTRRYKTSREKTACDLYREWERRLSVTMRQTHAAGERLFVDYAGDGVPVVIDRLTGEIRMAQTFVAVLGASSFTFAKASWTQTLPDWIDAHVSALQATGGVPQLIVPDNAKTAIVKACFYDPQSIAPTPTWRPIIGPRFCRRGRENRGTKQRSKRRC